MTVTRVGSISSLQTPHVDIKNTSFLLVRRYVYRLAS